MIETLVHVVSSRAASPVIHGPDAEGAHDIRSEGRWITELGFGAACAAFSEVSRW